MSSLDFYVPLHLRYVDDIQLFLPKDEDFVLNKFHNFHNRLKLTEEVPNSNSLNFLDITIIDENDNFSSNW